MSKVIKSNNIGHRVKGHHVKFHKVHHVKVIFVVKLYLFCLSMFCSDSVTDEVVGTHFIDLSQISNDGANGMC